ncbi:MAG: LPS export ABC transporter ATP-binding protein [Vampirovibrionia bacterium]
MTIKAVDLKKIYNDKPVVNNLSFEVNPGEIVGLLGPNGAGKTTSFYMIVGLVKADGGTVSLNNEDLTYLPMHMRARKGIGYLPQETSIFRRLTVEDNIKLVLEMQDLSEKHINDRVDKLLAEFNIEKLRNTVAIQLSGGERRRLEIARALATSPKFILLDEPFTGIDPIAIADIQKIISKLRDDGIGILLTDHNPRATLSVTDRAYIVHEGEIRVQGSSEQVSNDPIAKKYYLGDDFTL